MMISNCLIFQRSLWILHLTDGRKVLRWSHPHSITMTDPVTEGGEHAWPHWGVNARHRLHRSPRVLCCFPNFVHFYIIDFFSRFLIFFKRKLDEFSFTLPSWPFWTLDWMDNAARVPRHSVQAAGGCVVRGKSGSRSTRWWGFPFPCGRIRWKREEKWAHWLVLFIKSFDPMEISSATWKVSKNVLLKTIVKLNPIPCLCVRFPFFIYANVCIIIIMIRPGPARTIFNQKGLWPKTWRYLVDSSTSPAGPLQSRRCGPA